MAKTTAMARVQGQTGTMHLRVVPRYVSQRSYERAPLSFAHYNDPWYKDGFVVLGLKEVYRSIHRWHQYGESTPGTHHPGKRGTATEVGRNGASWPEIKEVPKTKDGLPRVNPVMGDNPTKMKINGRWYQWYRGRWVPMARRVKNPDRKRVPNDLRLQHGPWWPKGRQEVIDVTRRMRSQREALAPLITDLQKEQDIKDLLEALGVS